MKRLDWLTVGLAMLASSVALAGCGDDAGRGDPGGAAGGSRSAEATTGGAGTEGALDLPPVGYAADVQPLFELACNCHTQDNFAQLGAPFSLAAGVAHGNLVSAPSQQAPGMVLISPGSLNDSYLWLKVNGTQTEVGGAGQIMPPGVPLNGTEKDLVARWIVGGAQP